MPLLRWEAAQHLLAACRLWTNASSPLGLHLWWLARFSIYLGEVVSCCLTCCLQQGLL